MGETKLTKTMKMVGMLYLKNNLCSIIAPEVSVWSTYNDWASNDKHYIIDLCGIGRKYIPYDEQVKDGPVSFPITRGIEIKISRGDFKNGFIHSGCNYHYLMVPKGLVDKSEVDKRIGIIEIEPEKLSVRRLGMKYSFNGLKVIRGAKFQETTQMMYDKVYNQMPTQATIQMLQWVREKLAD